MKLWRCHINGDTFIALINVLPKRYVQHADTDVMKVKGDRKVVMEASLYISFFCYLPPGLTDHTECPGVMITAWLGVTCSLSP